MRGTEKCFVISEISGHVMFENIYIYIYMKVKAETFYFDTHHDSNPDPDPKFLLNYGQYFNIFKYKIVKNKTSRCILY